MHKETVDPRLFAQQAPQFIQKIGLGKLEWKLERRPRCRAAV
jgi:hypothetical protein